MRMRKNGKGEKKSVGVYMDIYINKYIYMCVCVCLYVSVCKN